MNNTLALIAGVAACFAASCLCLRLLKKYKHRQDTHTPTASTPVEHRQRPKQQATTEPLQHPIAMRLLYRNSRGEVAWYQGTMISRKPEENGSRSVNVRLDGEVMVKGFLIERMQQLELSENGRVIEGSNNIRALLMQRLRLGKTRKPPAKTKQSIKQEDGGSFGFLEALLPADAIGFAAIDLETTSLSTQNARIVEIAMVLISRDGTLEEAWESLIHPGTRIGNAAVHGVNDTMVSGAPSFNELAPLIAQKLQGRVLVAHNLKRYDLPILQRHFEELPHLNISLGDGIDTMPQPMRKLKDLCAEHGILLNEKDAHTAGGDSQVLAALLKQKPKHLRPAQAAAQLNGMIPDLSTVATLKRCDARDSSIEIEKSEEPGRFKREHWSSSKLELDQGLVFVATGPPSMAKNTEIHQAEAHAQHIGLIYRKVSSIAKRNPPAFLLSTSLCLNTTKMRTARERAIPVVLASDLMRCQRGDAVAMHQWCSTVT